MKTARSSSKSLSRQLSKKGKLTTVSLFSAFALGSLALGFLIWKMNDPASLAATDTSANQKSTIECTDTIRETYDNSLRLGKLFRVGGDYPQGTYASGGMLRLRSNQGKSAQLLLAPQIKGNFTYQTSFAGINVTKGEFMPFAEVVVTLGQERFVSRFTQSGQRSRGQVFYKPAADQPWQTSEIGEFPAEFKYRFLRRKNKVMVMVKPIDKADPFKVVYEHDLSDPEALANLSLLSNLAVAPGKSMEGYSSTARFKNFRIFCPSEIENEWVKDDEV